MVEEDRLALAAEELMMTEDELRTFASAVALVAPRPLSVNDLIALVSTRHERATAKSPHPSSAATAQPARGRFRFRFHKDR